MQLKEGVKIGKLSTQALLGMMIANSVAIRLNLPELVITSVNDGVHGKDSLHPLGDAFDIRTNNLTATQPKVFLIALRMALGKDFDVLLEDDHIHIEYDPKPKKVKV